MHAIRRKFLFKKSKTKGINVPFYRQLKQKVTVLEAVYAHDGIGGQVVTWQNKYRLWAVVNKIPPGKQGSMVKQHRKQDVRHYYHIVVRGGVMVTTEMRIIYRESLLHISSVIDPDDTGRVLEITAQDGVVV